MGPRGSRTDALCAAGGVLLELVQLAQLKAQGIITEDEFQAKKKQILGI